MKEFLQGIVLGLANIIPGVSGGTMALVMGIYERFISALNRLSDFRMLRFAIAAVGFRRGAWRELREALLAADLFFLMKIGAGAFFAIIAASRFMADALENHYAAAHGFFFGLVAVSVIYPVRYLKRRSWRELTAFLLALVLTLGLNGLVSDEARIARAEHKETLRIESAEAVMTPAAETADSRSLLSLEHPGAARLGFILLSAALALSAMVLPGISGSFVLLLLGVYFDVLLAINERQVIVLAVFCCGAAAGLILFARIMSRLLEKLYNPTMAFMIGLMVASLYRLWPFRTVRQIGEEAVYLNNYIPQSWSGSDLAVLLWMATGAGLIFAVILLEKTLKAEQPRELN